MNRGPKQYFDSGDYNTVRAKMQKNKIPGMGENPSMSRLRKSSQSNLVFPGKK